MPITLSYTVTLSAGGDEFTIDHSASDFTSLPGGVADLDTASLTVYKPNDNTGTVFNVLADLKAGTSVVLDNSDFGGTAGEVLADGVWQFYLEVEDTATSSTANSTVYKYTYTKILNKMMPRIAEFDDFFDLEGTCYKKLVDETFFAYMQLQGGIFSHQNQSYTNAQAKIDALTTYFGSDFDCGCKKVNCL